MKTYNQQIFELTLIINKEMIIYLKKGQENNIIYNIKNNEINI